MKDKDSQLIFETYIKESPDRWPDGSKMDSERARHLDSLRARDEKRDGKHDVAAKVKERFDISVEWHDHVGHPEGGEWHRTDEEVLPGSEESRPVTDDELEKIMIIEDPERALERWPSLRDHPELFENKHMPLGDEHNPGEPDNVDYKAMFSAMDRSKENEDIAMKYEGLGDEELQKHMNVIDYLIDMGEDDRNAYFGGDKGAPW